MNWSKNDCYFARNLALESIRIMIVQILQNQIYWYYTCTFAIATAHTYTFICVSASVILVVFGQSLLFGLLSITTHEWVFPATRNTHSHTQHTLSHIIRRHTNVCKLYLPLPLWMASKISDILFCLGSRDPQVSVLNSCARIYSCGSIKARAATMETERKPQPNAELNTTTERMWLK